MGCAGRLVWALESCTAVLSWSAGRLVRGAPRAEQQLSLESCCCLRGRRHPFAACPLAWRVHSLWLSYQNLGVLAGKKTPCLLAGIEVCARHIPVKCSREFFATFQDCENNPHERVKQEVEMPSTYYAYNPAAVDNVSLHEKGRGREAYEVHQTTLQR